MAVVTEPPWVNQTSGTSARNGTTSHVIPFGFTSTAGNELVVILYGAVTHTVSAGSWTEQLQPVNSGELSVFTKTSTGDSSITDTTNGSDYPVAWVAYELPSGSVWSTGAGANPTTDTFAALTGLPGVEVVVWAARGRTVHGSPTAGASTWAGAFVEDADQYTGPTATEGAYLTAAHQINVTTTSITPAATTTYTGTWGGTDRQHVVFAVNVASAGGTTVVTKNVATTWNVAAIVTKTVASTWNTAAVVAKTVATSWDTSASVTKSVATSWNTAAVTTKSVATTWNVAAIVSKTAATSWDVAATVTKDVATTWDTAAQVAKPVATSWDVAATVAKGTATTWDVAAQTTKSVATTWDTAAVVATSVSTSWDVQATGQVTTSVTTRWDVAAITNAAVATTWDVRAQVAASYATAWSVATLVTRSVTTGWAVDGGTAPARVPAARGAVTTRSTTAAVHTRSTSAGPVIR